MRGRECDPALGWRTAGRIREAATGNVLVQAAIGAGQEQRLNGHQRLGTLTGRVTMDIGR